MAKIQAQTPNAGEDVEQQECSDNAGGDAKWDSHFGKIAWQFFKMLSIELSYDLEILLLGIYPREMKTCSCKSLYTNIHSSTNHSSQRSGNNPDVHQLMNRYTMVKIMESYLAMKGVKY